MRTVPVNQSAGPFAEGVDPTRLISICAPPARKQVHAHQWGRLSDFTRPDRAGAVRVLPGPLSFLAAEFPEAKTISIIHNVFRRPPPSAGQPRADIRRVVRI